ncbi:MAG: Nif3-like dinuclear metal center hexameric protein [Actinomycetia bacterium]|nr:Nif3-like dinuclear metal center hexameric protein [Actinomycetes bacterium]
MISPTVGDIVADLDALYPPATAEDWDVVGLTCGDRASQVRRVMFAVDPLPAVVDEALAWGADLLVTHHPLLLRPTHSVATDNWKGSLLHRLIRDGCALYTAHTNADVALDGVNDALAEALGLTDTKPLRVWPAEPADNLVTFVPPDHADAVIAALTRVGAGTIGNYAGCAWKVSGTGTFTPGEGANPVIGEVGRTEVTAEARVEMLVPRSLRSAALDAIRVAHPYEEVAIDIIELAAAASGTGLGRVGSLADPAPLAAFAQRVADALPSTPAGVRFHGDPETVVERVAVCGGSGASLLADAARVGVDVFVTADLRHHPASEALVAGGPALVDPGHWASEWPWLPVAAARLMQALARRDPSATTVETYISTVVTDPVTGHVRSRLEEDR